jgi:hypothetical protein
VVALLCVAGLYPALRYVRHAYYPFPKARAVENQYEYVIGKWVHDHWPGERVLPSGTVRFWFNAWFDNPQTDGGSAQGMLNQILPMASYQITAGDRGEIAVLWLQALGTDAVIVPDRTSPEWYHDYVKPEKFRGLGPVLYDDRRGTVIYRIPRVHSGIGRVVESAKIAAVGAVRGGDDVQTLQQYVSAVEDPAQALTEVRWKSFDEFVVQAQAGREQSLLLQETYDPAWHAYEDGKPLTIRRERVMGFMLIDVPEGAHRVQLRFETPLENRIGQAVFFLGMLGIFVLVVAGLKQKLQSELDAPGITG